MTSLIHIILSIPPAFLVVVLAGMALMTALIFHKGTEISQELDSALAALQSEDQHMDAPAPTTTPTVDAESAPVAPATAQQPKPNGPAIAPAMAGSRLHDKENGR